MGFEKGNKIFGKNELFGGVENERENEKVLKISVHFALSSVEGSEKDFFKNAAAELAKKYFSPSRGNSG